MTSQNFDNFCFPSGSSTGLFARAIIARVVELVDFLSSRRGLFDAVGWVNLLGDSSVCKGYQSLIATKFEILECVLAYCVQYIIWKMRSPARFTSFLFFFVAFQLLCEILDVALYLFVYKFFIITGSTSFSEVRLSFWVPNLTISLLRTITTDFPGFLTFEVVGPNFTIFEPVVSSSQRPSKFLRLFHPVHFMGQFEL